MTDMREEKFAFRLDIDANLNKRFQKVLDLRGISRTEAITRMVEWFLDQPEVCQQTILRQLPEDLEVDIASIMLKRMAAKQASDHKKSQASKKASQNRRDQRGSA